MSQARPGKVTLESVVEPLNLGLNDGTYMPEACVEVLRRHLAVGRTALRHYTTANNDPLRDAIAKTDGVTRDHVFLHNGSGPILKQVMPEIIRDAIKSSPMRMLRHLVKKDGYPIVTPTITYGKVPAKALAQGYRLEMIEIRPEDGFRLHADAVAKDLSRRDGLVYIVNPNNPTGNLLMSRADIESLVARFPRSTFYVDEAYIQYAEPGSSVSDLVPKYANLCVSRTFSFAYGLAGVRIGYLLAHPDVVKTHHGTLTDYRLGWLQEQLGIAALEDNDHLPWIRKVSAEARDEIVAAITRLGPIQAFPSITNFVLFRFTDGRKAKPLVHGLEQRGIHIKDIEPFGAYRFDEYFRVTLGLPHEHQRLVSSMAEVLGA